MPARGNAVARVGCPLLRLSRIGLSRVGLTWIGLTWIGLTWVRLTCVRLTWIGLTRVGLTRVGLARLRLPVERRLAGARPARIGRLTGGLPGPGAGEPRVVLSPSMGGSRPPLPLSSTMRGPRPRFPLGSTMRGSRPPGPLGSSMGASGRPHPLALARRPALAVLGRGLPRAGIARARRELSPSMGGSRPPFPLAPSMGGSRPPRSLAGRTRPGLSLTGARSLPGPRAPGVLSVLCTSLGGSRSPCPLAGRTRPGLSLTGARSLPGPGVGEPGVVLSPSMGGSRSPCPLAASLGGSRRRFPLARPALPAARRARPALSGRDSSGRLPGPGAVHTGVRLRLAARPALASGPAWPRCGLPGAGASRVLAVLAVAELASSVGGSSAPFPRALAELAASVGSSRPPCTLALALARGGPGRLPAAGAPDPLAELSRRLLVRRIRTGSVLSLPVRARVSRGVLAGRAVPVRPERVRAGPGVSGPVPRLARSLLVRLPGRRPLP